MMLDLVKDMWGLRQVLEPDLINCFSHLSFVCVGNPLNLVPCPNIRKEFLLVLFFFFFCVPQLEL